MLLLLLSALGLAGPPAVLADCTATGQGNRRGLSCPTLSAGLYDGPTDDPAAALTALADGFASAVKDQLLERQREPFTLPGVSAAFVQVFQDAQSELFVVRAANARSGGLRLVECTLRAPTVKAAHQTCDAVVVHLLKHGIDLPTQAQTKRDPIASRLGSPVVVPHGCEVRPSEGMTEYYCPDGMMLLVATPKGQSTEALLRTLQEQTAQHFERNGGANAIRSASACEIRGAAAQCATVSARVPTMGTLRSAIAPLSSPGGDVVAVCSGPGAVPEVCAPYITTGPAYE